MGFLRFLVAKGVSKAIMAGVPTPHVDGAKQAAKLGQATYTIDLPYDLASEQIDDIVATGLWQLESSTDTRRSNGPTPSHSDRVLQCTFTRISAEVASPPTESYNRLQRIDRAGSEQPAQKPVQKTRSDPGFEAERAAFETILRDVTFWYDAQNPVMSGDGAFVDVLREIVERDFPFRVTGESFFVPSGQASISFKMQLARKPAEPLPQPLFAQNFTLEFSEEFLNRPPAPPSVARADWHPDPSGRHQLRYHDGLKWTVHVSTDGVQTTDAVP